MGTVDNIWLWLIINTKKKLKYNFDYISLMVIGNYTTTSINKFNKHLNSIAFKEI